MRRRKVISHKHCNCQQGRKEAFVSLQQCAEKSLWAPRRKVFEGTTSRLTFMTSCSLGATCRAGGCGRCGARVLAAVLHASCSDAGYASPSGGLTCAALERVWCA